MERVLKALRQIVGTDQAIRVDEPMSRHTTFGVGGPADIFIDAAADELKDILNLLSEEKFPFTVIGNGSNLLVSDKGIRGAVICIGKRMSGIEVRDGDGVADISAASGALLPIVARRACENGLTGLEFATQIPGTIGGAVYMNAGAFGGDMSDSVVSVTAVDMNGTEKKYTADQIGFDYRTSIFSKNKEIITGAVLHLRRDDPEQIKARAAAIREKREKSQPVGKRSAGSTFRKLGDGDTPEAMTPAWKLVQEAGMGDARVGGACVSPKHSGFVINDGEATASDIYNLISQIIEQVKLKTGVTLEPEVKIIGTF
ncbi:MAG: UDP-N-acetylmuramate dehydrogenase [Lachnospiraceae bacterium]|uniref:UDP-N-acetylenolpyruvoylglucosamine reductase n=1 Tax=Candidatus Weimeria bifida TaxID=2599074 RepID=A0A6N7IZX2_9FIRM|nr:UDP-N-acetylmuramate dehydrogenase [Candidatus Weimeria bifida]RRF96454.1 MAG: UDP-N-acetylmuramate dehydrogenase [Lachnospiraceae bacterium]